MALLRLHALLDIDGHLQKATLKRYVTAHLQLVTLRQDSVGAIEIHLLFL